MPTRRVPRVATIHDEVKETIKAHLTLVHVFHAYASVDTSLVAHVLSHYTSVMYGRIASISAAHNATQFGDFICLICISTVQMLVQQGSTDAGLNRHRRGLPPWSSEYQIRPLPFLPIQYSPFSPQLPRPITNYANHSTILLNHIGPPSIRKGPIMSGFQPLVFCRQPTQLSIAHYRYVSFIGVSKVV
jgi:hypothetical protein